MESNSCPTYDKFIPFDAVNHDEWNDLFNDLVKLEDKLILSDGRKLIHVRPR